MSFHYALVTGTSSGLGLEMAQSLLDRDFIVFGLSRSGSPISHGHFVDVVGDIKNELDVEQMMGVIREQTESIHLVVNNAGVFQQDPLEETSSKDFLDQLQTNVLGPFHILKHVEEFLVNEQTQVISVLSLAIKKNFPQLAAYTSSKYALKGLLEVAKEEWKSRNIRFTNLIPGAIDTPLWEKGSVEIPENLMLNIEDFIRVFNMVIDSPVSVEFPEIQMVNSLGDRQ